ncbi:hypothetical protein FNF27_06294 [Cafeteria roenbergensis]|uniref:histidine kinase n=1 Tax=Cafeteria roenbergensis TaxID=33653 RepID=A0A5A8E3L3_CAFRO|nr:hypothetical protein FNF27_06294 [Cafeteria roenbergensis]
MSAVALAAPFLARLTEAAYLVTPGPPMMAANEHIRGLVTANGSASLLRTKARVEDLQSAAQVPAAAGFAAALLVAALAISGSGLVKLRVRRASLGVALGVFLGVLPAFATHSLGSPTMLVPTLEIFSIGHHCCTFIELPALCVMMVVVVVSLGFAETLSSDVLRPKQQPFSDSVRAACQRVCMIQLPSVDGFLILRVVQAGMVACFLAAVAGAVGTGANSLGMAGALFVYWATMASVTAMFVVATLDQLSQTRRSSVSPASTASSTPGATVALATDLVAGGTLHAGASRARSRSAVSTARGTSISGEYTSSGQSEASTEFAAGEFCRPSCTPASATFFAQLVALAVGIVAPNVAIVIFLAHGHNGHGSCLTTFGNVAEIARRFDHWPHGCTSADCRESIIASLELTVYATWIASVVVASSCALAIMYGQATVAKERAEDARKAADHMHSALCYVSHEARSPLNGAALSLALLDGIIRGDGDPSEAPQLVGDLHASVEAAKRQLDDMLTFERVTSLRAARSVEWGWSRVAGSELRRLRSSFAGVCRAERVKLRFRGVSSRPACGGLGSSIIRESSFVSGQLSLLRHVKLGKVEGAVEPTNDDSAVTAADIRSGAESGSSAGNGSQLHTAAGRSGGDVSSAASIAAGKTAPSAALGVPSAPLAAEGICMHGSSATRKTVAVQSLASQPADGRGGFVWSSRPAVPQPHRGAVERDDPAPLLSLTTGPAIAGAGAGRSGVVAVSGRSSSKGVEMAGQPFFDSSQTGSSENVARTTSSGGSIDALNVSETRGLLKLPPRPGGAPAEVPSSQGAGVLSPAPAMEAHPAGVRAPAGGLTAAAAAAAAALPSPRQQPEQDSAHGPASRLGAAPAATHRRPAPKPAAPNALSSNAGGNTEDSRSTPGNVRKPSRRPTHGEPVADFEVFADIDRIMSVIGNALSNAIKYVTSSDGRGRVTVSLVLAAPSLLPGSRPMRAPKAAQRGYCKLAPACCPPPRQPTRPPRGAQTAASPEPGSAYIAGGSRGSRGSRAGPSSQDVDGPTRACERKVLVIEVLDNGRGIAEERLSADTLFRPFQQLRMGDGMLSMAAGGLGLSTVRAIVVDQMGGDVSLASKLGVGTLFTARIPVWARRRIVGPEFDTSHAWSEDGTLSEAGSDVAWGLVRETTSMAATTWRSERGFASDRNVARALRAWGFAVAEMEDGRRAMDALQALVRSSAAPEAGTVGSPAAVPESAAASAAPLGGASRWPDAVLLDSRMPELDGEGVLRELRELAASLASSGEAAMAARVRAIPVLGATGSTDAVEQGSLLRGGALAILVKPIDPVELALALEREARVALPPQARERQGVE